MAPLLPMEAVPLTRPDNHEYARQLVEYLPDASYAEAIRAYQVFLNDPNIDDYVAAQVGLHDRYFFLTMILRVNFMRDQVHRPEWVYERVREVEVCTDGYIDLWARAHFKSTIITFGGSMQEIARDSGLYSLMYDQRQDRPTTIGIFSHTRPIAKSFLNQIKTECEMNALLPRLYPDVFWVDSKKQAPLWSLDGGIVCQRVGNPREATVEAWGLVDSQPTSKHFKLMIYDDTVEIKSVSTPEMIMKTTEAWELSRNLASIDKAKQPRTWYIGTRYNYADTYAVIIARGAAKPRIHAATHNGLPDGKPILLSQEQWDMKKKTESAKTIACQQLQNPLAGEEQEFKMSWVRRYEVRPQTLNVAVCVDPASSKKKHSSNTAMAVIGMDALHNKYLLDGMCHKMSLTERWKNLKYLRFKWLKAPGIQIVKVGYEKYGMQADIEHFKEMMKIEKNAFPIEEVSWPRERAEGGKDDRIRRLIPDHQNWRFFYPWEPVPTELSICKGCGDAEACVALCDIGRKIKDTKLMRQMVDRGKPYLVAKPIRYKNEDKRIYNLVHYLLNNEYGFFPATTWKDLLDAMSRIYDLEMNPPQIVHEKDIEPEVMGDD